MMPPSQKKRGLMAIEKSKLPTHLPHTIIGNGDTQLFVTGNDVYTMNGTFLGKISDAQKKLWEQLAHESHFHPRD